MFCLLYSPKQKSLNFHAQKQIGKRHVIDIFTSEDMENISLCSFQYLTLYYIIKLYISPALNCTVVMLRTFHYVLIVRLALFPDGSIHFLILKYASRALMFSVKTRSAFEKCLRFSFFMSDFLQAKGKPFQGVQE